MVRAITGRRPQRSASELNSQPPRVPAQQKNSQQPFAPQSDQGGVRCDFEQLWQHVGSSDVVELSFKGIEDPAE